MKKILSPKILLSNLMVALIVFFTLTSFTKLYGQTNYVVNGRTITKINAKYYNIIGEDTLKVIGNHFLIIPKSGQELSAIDYLQTHYSNTITYYDRLNFIDFKINSNEDYAQIVNNVSSLGFVSKLITANYLKNIAQGYPNDPASSNDTWIVESMELNEAWEITTGNPEIVVAIIDDGRDYDDIDLNQSEVQGWDFIESDNDPDPYIYYPSHGTAMSGCIAARTNNNYGTWGVAGGWNSAPVKKMMLRNQTRDPLNYDLLFDVFGFLEAIEYAIDHEAKVINMSYGAPVEEWLLAGGEEYMVQLDNAINLAHETGIVMFASAGDAGYSYVLYPASHEHVISCGACNSEFTRLNMPLIECVSNYGTGAEITLPGAYVHANWGDGNVPYPNHQQFSSGFGTSFSTAFASGIAALMLSVNPCLTPDEIKEILYQSCRVWDPNYYTLVPSPGWNSELGYGIVDAKTAINLAMSSETTYISGDIIWNSNKTSGNIIINPQSKLTLEGMTLGMMDNTAITVMPQGKLIVNNSTITNACNSSTKRWKGITVYGNRFQSSQSPAYHGLATFTNSTVENAEKALYVPMTTQYAGGIIWATSSYFLNNDNAFDFIGYNYSSLSHFSRCTFEVNEDFIGSYSNSNIMVKLTSMKGISFYTCVFNNSKTTTPVGVAIRADGSSYTITGLCNSNQYPCPPENIETGQIVNFDRGIYTTYSNFSARTKVEYTDFVGNNRGAYFSLNGYFDVLNCDFQIPEHIPNGVDTYGLYLDNCSGYHIENNIFESHLPNTTGQIGLYIYKSGVAQNYIYRNTFTRLSRAAVADGNNRSSGGATGLCFKCNDFSSTGTDIDIVIPQGTSTTPYSGISLYQGLPSAGNPSAQKDTLAAGNTFTLTTSAYNIRNLSGNFSNYYYHQFTNPPGIKVKPDPVYIINRIQNDQTTYNKDNICKSWITSGSPISIDGLISQKETAATQADATSTQLITLVDGGSTENLTMDVLGATAPEALDLHDQLLSESPYLSDTVMKTAIERENVLPNAMVRDVLVENPQAAKSEEIMAMLGERWDPMPEYMQEEIEAGATIIGGREQLEAIRDGWQQQERHLYNRIVNSYLSDTINPNASEELKAFLQTENTPEPAFLLADILLGENNYEAASQAITTLQGNLALDAFLVQQAADYLTMIGILQTLQTDSIQPFALDSLHAVPLFNLYQSGENAACVMARDMLIASGLLNYQEPINDYEVTKSIKAEQKTFISKGAESGESLRLLPNPASTYTIAEYNIFSKQGNAMLALHNIAGNIVWKEDIVKTNDQLVIDLTGIKPGVYTVSLSCGNKIISSRKLTVSK